MSLLLLLGSATILIAVTGRRPDTLIGHTLTGCLLIGGLMSWSAFVLGPISGFMIAAGYRSSELAADRFAADLVGARGAALPAWLSARGTWPTNPVHRARLRVAGSHPSPQRRQQLDQPDRRPTSRRRPRWSIRRGSEPGQQLCLDIHVRPADLIPEPRLPASILEKLVPVSLESSNRWPAQTAAPACPVSCSRVVALSC